MVLPDDFSGEAVDGLHDAAGVGQIDHAIVDDRGWLVGAALIHWRLPDQLQVLDVVAVDLVERAVIGGEVVAPDHQPVARIGLSEHGVGDRNEVRHFTGDGESSGAGLGCRSSAGARTLSACSALPTASALSTLSTLSSALPALSGRRLLGSDDENTQDDDSYQSKPKKFFQTEHGSSYFSSQPSRWPFGIPSL